QYVVLSAADQRVFGRIGLLVGLVLHDLLLGGIAEAVLEALHVVLAVVVVLVQHPDLRVRNDDYGKDYGKGLKDGLGDAAKKLIVMEQTYETSDPTIDSQIVNLKNSGANVFYNVTIPKYAAQAIKKTAETGWKPLHLLNNVSNSVGAVLKPAGLQNSKDIVSTFYLKDPTDPTWQNDAGYKDWLAFMKKYYPEGDLSDLGNVY